MRLTQVAREAWRNVSTGASHTVMLIVLISTLLSGLAWLEMSTVVGLQAKATAFREAAASTLVLEAQGRVDGPACDRLALLEGVRASGAARSHPDGVQPLATPRNSIPTYEVTPGFPEVLGSTSAGGLVVSRAVADAWSLNAGDRVSARGGILPVGGVYEFPEDGRSTVLQYAALAPGEPTGRYDVCWMDVWPPDPQAEPLLLTALSPAIPADAQTKISQLNTRLGQDLPAINDFELRITRWTPLAAFVLAAVLTLGVAQLRRLELAFARHLGVARSSQSAQLMVECAVWSIAVLAFAGVVVAWQATTTGHFDTAVALLGARVVILGVLGCFVGSILTALMVSHKQLYRYFKDR